MRRGTGNGADRALSAQLKELWGPARRAFAHRNGAETMAGAAALRGSVVREEVKTAAAGAHSSSARSEDCRSPPAAS